MKSSSWKFGAVAAMAMAACAMVPQAQAAFITLSPTPASPTTIVNQPVSVDIVVNGLSSAAGAFSLLLDYGNLTFGSYSIGPGFGIALDLSPGDLGGTVSLAALEDFFVLEPAAYLAQGSGGNFTLATVTFTGPATPGAFTLGLRDVAISDFNGRGLLACTGVACGNLIPEPTTPLLVMAALGALALIRKQQSV